MENTDPDLLSLAINTYWLVRGLIEPIQTIKKFNNRITTLVQQDYPLDQIDKINMWHFYRYQPIAHNITKNVVLKGGEIENIHPVMCSLYTEIGNGILKLQEPLEAAQQSGKLDYVSLKQDYTRLPTEEESIRISFKNYHSIKGVEWE